jgi:SAM-dependent methyltransferase
VEDDPMACSCGERNTEWLDDPEVGDQVRLLAQRDLDRANAWFGGNLAVVRTIGPLLARWPSDSATVLDVGTGAGGIARLVRAEGRRRGVAVTTLGLDLRLALARASLATGSVAIRGDVSRLPFADRSADMVVCSQLLHHFRRLEALQVLRELTRVARVQVIVADLRRSRLAAMAFRFASRALGFHPVTRHDGVVSVRRGFSPVELDSLVWAAVGCAPTVRRSLGFRLVASWSPPPPRPDAVWTPQERSAA